MEERILNFFKNDRSYNGAMDLYREIGQRVRLKSFFATLPESELKDLIFDELREMAGISPMEFQSIMKTPVVPPLVVSPATREKEASVGISKPTVPLNPSDNYPVEPRKIDLKTLEVFRIQDEFPFISSPDCPSELKILVSDMITTHDQYIKSRESLFTVETNQEILDASKSAVENYLENRSIWAELNYYKDHGQLLGKHRLLKKFKRTKELQEMNVFELFKLKKRLENNISQNKLIMTRNPTHHSNCNRSRRDMEMKDELSEVKKLLNS